MVNATSVLGAALVTWGHADGVVRVKMKKEQPPWPVVKSPGLDPVCNSLKESFLVAVAYLQSAS